jgi:hypothetical protein
MAIVVVPQINLFIFDRPPRTLGKDIVETPAFAGHADGDLTLFQFRLKHYTLRLRRGRPHIGRSVKFSSKYRPVIGHFS